MKVEDVTAQDLLVEVDGESVHPDSVDSLALLRLATSYMELASRVAEQGGKELRFSGLWVEDKCAAVHTRTTNAGLLAASVRACESYLSGVTPPRGIKGAVTNVHKAIQALPPGISPFVRTGSECFRLVKPQEPEPDKPWARTKLWVRPQEVGGNGVNDHVTLESTSETGPFSLRISADKAREIGTHLHHPVLAEMLVVRDANGRICKGELLGFVAPEVPHGDGVNAWRQWIKNSVDADATMDELRTKD